MPVVSGRFWLVLVNKVSVMFKEQQLVARKEKSSILSKLSNINETQKSPLDQKSRRERSLEPTN